MCRSSNNFNAIRNTNFERAFFQATQLTQNNQQNFVASPVSALILLSVLLGSTGPKGNTANQICKAIRGKDENCSPQMLKEAYKANKHLLKQLISVKDENDSKNIIAHVANTLFIDNSFNVLSEFEKRIQKYGKGQLQRTSFRSSDAFNDINKWVAEATQDLITQFYENESQLSKDTLMVLLNVVFFKDKWMQTFVKEDTRDYEFRLSEKKSLSVPMMKKEENSLQYYKNEDAGYHLVIKDFSNSRFKFYIILPLKNMNLKAVEYALSNTFDWKTVKEEAKEASVLLTLPKFKLEHEIDMMATYKSLGISDLFTRGLANLTGITEEVALYVGAAKQKTVIEVDEAGVKAAAVTGMQIGITSIFYPDVNFMVDQPFFCAIIDDKLQLPLFIARITNPTTAN